MTFPVSWLKLSVDALTEKLECPLCHAAPLEMCTGLGDKPRNPHRERVMDAVYVQTALRASEGLRILNEL